MQKSSSKTKQAYSKKQRVLIYLAVFSFIWLLFDVFYGGNIPFYAKWLECGQRPLEARGAGYLNDGAAHYEPGKNGLPIRSDTLFCTPLEAERAGYSANKNTYDFPNLRAE